MFGIFENHGCSAIKNLLKKKELTIKEKWDIAVFWSLQLVRTPRTRTGFEVMMKEVLINTTKSLDKLGVFGELPDILKKHGQSLTEIKVMFRI